jgi:hypothetical protein
MIFLLDASELLQLADNPILSFLVCKPDYLHRAEGFFTIPLRKFDCLRGYPFFNFLLPRYLEQKLAFGLFLFFPLNAIFLVLPQLPFLFIPLVDTVHGRLIFF